MSGATHHWPATPIAELAPRLVRVAEGYCLMLGMRRLGYVTVETVEWLKARAEPMVLAPVGEGKP